jgi:hypothetical protein
VRPFISRQKVENLTGRIASIRAADLDPFTELRVELPIELGIAQSQAFERVGPVHMDSPDGRIERIPPPFIAKFADRRAGVRNMPGAASPIASAREDPETRQ